MAIYAINFKSIINLVVMKYLFALRCIIGSALAIFVLRYFFNVKDITFWEGVCITIVVMGGFTVLVHVFFFIIKEK